ncbi:hypothetical protein BABINDRAFT_159558 [Babjeviella inositovora NRRL Y-12698]|uniref:DNA polymerase n=1 Tax=Babjeviella inositovora NRRL Y-12698 TaxID=984486 RepID=A0A1E3QZQ5_9ASCO|nr:uncharacterized protein BABINDRAFT_159558 [Babjeviella inositovora NRRL Y-12698]ODQ83101.1 hypothetical protein BABINDRAFT_159558 [Babjeviella inositovora NRRL Y-12698]
MPQHQIFRDVTFYIVPKTNSKLLVHRKEIFKRHGATLRYSIPLESNRRNGTKITNIVVVLDEKLKKEEILRDLQMELSTLLLPVVNSAWVSEGIEKNTILPVDGYEIFLSPKIPNKRTLKRNAQDENDQKKTKLESQNKLESQEKPEVPPNQRILHFLKLMSDEYEKTNQTWKSQSYRKAIESIKNTAFNIRTYEQAIKLPHVGKSLASKIVEILQTNSLKQLQTVQRDPKLIVLAIFEKIFGVGTHTAEKWYYEGLRTLEDVKAEKYMGLSDLQKYGLQYYDDWSQRIPRVEGEKHDQYVRMACHKIDPQAEVHIMGSYRRGAATMGDIDFIITKKETKILELKGILRRLVADLEKSGYIKCQLRGVEKRGEIKSKLFCGAQLANYPFCRRVDFLVVPSDEIGAAFLYFTGNTTFNRHMRQRAIDMGLKLSNSGLYRVEDSGDPNTPREVLLESKDERTIFKLLNMEWRDPVERNFGGFEEEGKSVKAAGDF